MSKLFFVGSYLLASVLVCFTVVRPVYADFPGDANERIARLENGMRQLQTRVAGLESRVASLEGFQPQPQPTGWVCAVTDDYSFWKQKHIGRAPTRLEAEAAAARACNADFQNAGLAGGVNCGGKAVCEPTTL